MTDAEQPFLSRRQRREAERATTGAPSDLVAEQSLLDAPLIPDAGSSTGESHGGIPSRKELRRIAHETGVIPMLTAEMLDAAEAGTLDIEGEIRQHTGTVPTLPAEIVVGVEPAQAPVDNSWPTGSLTPMTETDDLGTTMPQWPSGSVPAIDDEVKKMEQRALTGDLTDVAEALARQAETVIAPVADPIAAAWTTPETTTRRPVGFDDIIAPPVAPTEPPQVVVPMNVDVDLPVSDVPTSAVYVEGDPSNVSASVAPIAPEQVIPEPIVIPTVVIPEAAVPVAAPEPVVEPEAIIVPEPVVVPEPVIAEEPVVEPEPVVEVPAASPEIPPAREGDWRDQLEADNDHEWVKNHGTGVGVMQSPTLQTLVVDSFHTGDIAGPINPTGEILITGQILLDQLIDDEQPTEAIDAGVDGNQLNIPRRASEALSIIGKPTPHEERKRIPSVGSAVAAGLAAFLGLLVVALGVLAYFTDIL